MVATSSTAKRLAKKAAKEAGKELARAGTEVISSKIIDPVKKSAINKGFSPALVHKVSDFVEEGTRSGAEKLKQSKRLHASIDSLGPTPKKKKKKKKKTKKENSLSYLIDKA